MKWGKERVLCVRIVGENKEEEKNIGFFL